MLCARAGQRMISPADGTPWCATSRMYMTPYDSGRERSSGGDGKRLSFHLVRNWRELRHTRNEGRISHFSESVLF